MLLPIIDFQTEINPQKPTLILLHGVFGRGKNFGQIGRAFSKKIQCLAFDLRNHGQAHSGPLDMQAMAEDVIETCLHLKLENIILLGHSMGGKIAMSAALEKSRHQAEWKQIFKALIVADVAPVAFSLPYQQMAVKLARLEFPALLTRKSASDFILEKVSEAENAMISMWLAQNLVPGNFPYWENNMAQIALDFENLTQWPAGKSLSTFHKPTLFLRGGKSNHLTPSSEAVISRLFPNFLIETIEESGHWLHAEQPEAFVRLVEKFLEI
ncbi:alpha/beta fold hydrolase [Acetobacteraceae bacterium]|nr:alpha/beta fold hydrolase [Acetobacteraceae bacterium]